jgi:hypothetical protein
MKKFDLKNETILQAIELGFDFHLSTDDNTTVEELKSLLLDFFDENREKLPRKEDECKVSGSGNSQSVIYGDYVCSGEILSYRDNAFDAPDTKIFHSDFVMQQRDGRMVHMNLFEYVGPTMYNAPEGYEYDERSGTHIFVQKQD